MLSENRVTAHTATYLTADLSVPGIVLGLLTLENGTNWFS